MFNDRYTLKKAKNGTIIQGKSLEQLKSLIGPEFDEMLDFLKKYGATVNEESGYLELYIPKDCPVGVDSIMAKIAHCRQIRK